jgi:hypothetical protein
MHCQSFSCSLGSATRPARHISKTEIVLVVLSGLYQIMLPHIWATSVKFLGNFPFNYTPGSVTGRGGLVKMMTYNPFKYTSGYVPPKLGDISEAETILLFSYS